MGDYQRQRDDEPSPSSRTSKGSSGGWRAKLFRRERSSSPAPSGSGGLRRSVSNFTRSNSGRAQSSPTSLTPQAAEPNKAAYRPPPASPGTQQLSNSSKSPQNANATADAGAAIELSPVRSRHSRSASNKGNDTVSLFNSASLTDDGDGSASIDDKGGGGGVGALSHMPSDEVRHDRRECGSFNLVDAVVNDVIGSNQEDSMNDENNNKKNNKDLADVENAGTVGMSSGLGDGGELPPLQDLTTNPSLRSLGDSDSVTYMSTDCSVASNSILDRGSGGAHGNLRHYSRSSVGTNGKRKSRKKKNSKRESDTPKEKLDTYSGVFLPCLAQIVGVIFFLRLPTITGQAGTIGATLIVLCCVFSTFITSLSLSAIASNGTIQAGGPYYIISRTLGVEIGGALGILFYLGTTLGASMHVMGAVETMTHRKKHAYQNNNVGLLFTLLDSCPPQVWSLLVMFVIARIVSVGSKYVTGAANFFLVTVGLSIFSILLGTIFFAFGLYDGSLSDEDREFNDNLYPNYRPDPRTGVTPTFWGLVAIFYPATTGIMAGTNRSSNLATPNKSIPIGTIGAIGVTTVLYLFQVWLLGSVVSNEVLIYNKLVLTTVAFPSRIVAKLGMVTSCIGAALQCMAGAPQLLGAIAADDAIPFLKFLTRKKRRKGDPPPPYMLNSGGSLLGLGGLGESTSIDQGDGNLSMASEKSEDIEFENSKRAVWFTWAIASLGTLLGNIDHITPILTMFYLMMYGGINLCCFLLAWVDSPGFRPQFKYFSRKTALIGFVWSFVLSFLISWVMALLALLLLFTIFKYIDLSAQQQSARGGRGGAKGGGSSSGTNWGDVFDSVKYKITTAILARVTGTENFHAKNWRPQLLTFVDTDEEGRPLSSEVLALAAQFRGGRGLNIVVSIKHGSYLRKGTFEISQHCSENLKKCMEKERLQGFCEVILTLSNFEEAVWSAVMHSGLGPVSPNTVLMSWMSDWRRRVNRNSNDGEELLTDESSIYYENENIAACSAHEFVNTLKGLGNMQRAVCILKGRKFPRCGDIMPIGSTIDIYWVVDDGGLCLLLSYIISRNSIWRRNANLQVFAVTTTAEDNNSDVELAVVEFLQQIRINATVHIVSMQNTDLADDFRARTCDVCPGGAPTLTIGEKFRAIKDDAMSASSSVSGGQVAFQSFLPLGDKACLPTNSAGSEEHDQLAKMTTANYRKYVEFPENSIIDPSHRFLVQESAEAFNTLIRQRSSSASLVVTHLPLPHKVSKAKEFMEYVDTMFKDIDNMLLIQGTGVEYLTTVA